MNTWRRGYTQIVVWILTVVLLLVACGSDTGLTTNPISNSNSAGTRTATPAGQKFADLDDGKRSPTKILQASFVLDPEQLQTAASADVIVYASSIAPCLTCGGVASPAPSNSEVYASDDLSLRLRTQIPDGNPVGKVDLSIAFQLDTTKLLIAPGDGLRLTLQQAILQDEAVKPSQIQAATGIPIHQDFQPKDIIQGKSAARSFSLTFDRADFSPRYLRLDLLLTSPIPQEAPPLAKDAPAKATTPANNQIYHGVDLATLTERANAPEQRQAYEQAVGKPVAWVGLTQKWHLSSAFPVQAAVWIREAGSVPCLQIELPTDQPEMLEQIQSGFQDREWQRWAESIQSFASPVMVVLGSPAAEVGEAVYRRIIQTVRQQSVPNLLWIYGGNGQDFPGEGWFDWLGLQVNPTSGSLTAWSEAVEKAYQSLTALNPGSPILLLSLGWQGEGWTSTETGGVDAVLTDILAGRWPRLMGFAWNQSAVDVSQTPELRQILQERVGRNESVSGKMQVIPLEAKSVLGIPSPLAFPSPQASPPSSQD
ncbi:MAG: hypothetical protein NW237_13175 [Cyanobacteriota bacterium]|nr:hypothetical protein [Cyanobacteriota bacterium]